MERRGTGTKREDSGREWRERRGVSARGWWKYARGCSVKEKGVHGRWVVIFVPASSLISPHLLRAAALTPRRAATPGRGAVALVGVRLS